MANATFRQVQQANDFAVLADDDIIPGVQAPYGAGDDGGYTGATIKEAIRDVVAAFLTAGTDISVVHDDPSDTLTVNFTGILYTDEAAQDAVGAMVDSTLTYNDTTPSLGVADAGVTNAKLANMSEATVKGRAAAAGTGAPVDITPAELAAILGTLGADDLMTNFGIRFNATVLDDAVAEFQLISTQNGNGEIRAGGGADIRFRTVATANVTVISQAGALTYNAVAGDGTLTGTDGPDGNVNLRCSSSTKILYIENRSGGTIAVNAWLYP